MIQPAPKLTSPEFFAQNDSLATRYQTASPSTQQSIILELYRLDLPLFQAWRIFDGLEREDYQQEAFLWLSRGLATYQPAKGPFTAWLRNYILKAYSKHVDSHPPTQPLDDNEEESADDLISTDPVFWRQVKSLCTDEEWSLVEMRYQKGMELEAISKALKGYYIEGIRNKLKRILDKIKQASLVQSPSARKFSSIDPRQTEWVSKRQIEARLGIRTRNLTELLDPKIKPDKCPMLLDPRDIVRIPAVRIRYLETGEGLIYPRFIRRSATGSATGRTGLV